MGSRRKPLGSASSGTRRLFIAFGAGLAGVVYLVLVLVPVATGRVEFSATATDIGSIERDGFPDAMYLAVTNGNLVFARARAWLSGRGEERRLFQLTAPVVSDDQLEEWNRSRDAEAPLDLSKLRLVAVFQGEEVKERWPELARRAVAGEPLDVSPEKVSLTGDTVVAKGQLSLPDFPGVRKSGLDWASARRMSHGIHHDSPGRILRHLLIALALLAVSFFTFRHHVRNPTRPSPGGLDLTPLEDGFLDG
ncbi:MAG: hypothetical protein ABFS86_06255 [Planctomycetota bacterium]